MRGNPFLFQWEYGFFRAYHSCGAQKLFSLGARTTFDRGARRCSIYPALQALATSLRMTNRLVIVNTYGVQYTFTYPSLRGALAPWQSASPLNRHYKTFYYGSVLKKQLQYLSNYDILNTKFNMLCEVCRKLRFFRSRRSNTLRCRKGAIKLYADSAPEKSYYGCRRCKAFLQKAPISQAKGRKLF